MRHRAMAVWLVALAGCGARYHRGSSANGTGANGSSSGGTGVASYLTRLRPTCAIGQQWVCQSGATYGTRCMCVESGGLNP